MDENKHSCPVCGSDAEVQHYTKYESAFWVCPTCGKYEITLSGYRLANNPHLGSYLFYHRFCFNENEFRYHTTLNKEQCDEYKKQFDKGINANGQPVHMDETIVESWYPKSFSERIDNILLRISSLSKHVGQSVSLSHPELCSLLFVEQKEKLENGLASEWRREEDCSTEVCYMLDYLIAGNYISCSPAPTVMESSYILTLRPEGYSRVDMLQKDSSNGKNVLVAMKFGNETIPLREAIRTGISNAGYHAVFIDEVEHNNQITPELLKHIRDSRFVVADLTHQNNGAYFEEGYAMGLGKPVIQLCQKDTKLHFDIAQKNTIIWETEADIPTRLENRIRATID